MGENGPRTQQDLGGLCLIWMETPQFLQAVCSTTEMFSNLLLWLTSITPYTMDRECGECIHCYLWQSFHILRLLYLTEFFSRLKWLWSLQSFLRSCFVGSEVFLLLFLCSMQKVGSVLQLKPLLSRVEGYFILLPDSAAVYILPVKYLSFVLSCDMLFCALLYNSPCARGSILKLSY